MPAQQLLAMQHRMLLSAGCWFPLLLTCPGRCKRCCVYVQLINLLDTVQHADAVLSAYPFVLNIPACELPAGCQPAQHACAGNKMTHQLLEHDLLLTCLALLAAARGLSSPMRLK